LVSYLTVPFLTHLYTGGSYLQLSTVVEDVLIAAFAVISGFFSDLFGRKRLAIIGFAMLGIGYAILGLTQTNVIGFYFYIIADGVAWGIFYTVLLFTIWGDLSQTSKSEKYFVIGAMPYLFSNFIRLLVGPYVSTFSLSGGIFTYACIFLFLAVLPLIYAPETLSDKTMKDRELKSYLEKAQKIAQKEAEKNQKDFAAGSEEIYVGNEEVMETPANEEARKLAEKYY